MRNKIFSVDEANRLIPYLEPALESLRELNAEIVRLKREIEVLDAIERSGATGRSADVRELREKETRIAGLTERFRGMIREIGSRGCVLRDLELGLVDFYTMARGQIVCLCWRRGEPRVEHWHPLDEGFSGRRPLAELP